MKRTDNRQKKMIQTPHQAGPSPKNFQPSSEVLHPQVFSGHGGSVYGLVSNLELATRIAQSAKQAHMSVHNFDKAGPLLAHARQKKPALIILDWDKCEAESFKVLNELAKDADLKGVPAIGHLASANRTLQEEARRAGCLRVYGKTEFRRELDQLLARYAP